MKTTIQIAIAIILLPAVAAIPRLADLHQDSTGQSLLKPVVKNANNA